MGKKTNNPNKTQLAYEHLRTQILEGTYKSGQRIIIDQIAKELGSSPIPVREAIRQLESEGLIQYKQYSGAVVTSINESEYIETLTVIGILEGYATALSSLYLTDSDYENLINLNKEMDEALQDFELELFGDLNRIFHTTIFEKCGNPILIEKIKETQHRLDRVRSTVFTIVPQRAVQSIQEHTDIIQVLREKAPFEKIEAIVREHKMNTITAFRKRKASIQDNKAL
ncbi:GntR family transcriptional regulator [Bacillus massiliigorillae]|uniref:GntR family transcriptional regulator n=1 Tax=Bacillus massiliigorillae TaxID=1243664 RepID=UPI0003A23581|nr:GntR family transcriptional regulator [Bacillus massiliigorillae]